MKENERKCIKCSCSPATDPTITLHRFPRPGRTNSLRCEIWAKYCFPNDSWSSPTFQAKLFSQHLMLCSKHFRSTSFIDKKLFKTAVPDEVCDKVVINTVLGGTEQSNIFHPTAGPSRILEPSSDNINFENSCQTTTVSDTKVNETTGQVVIKPVTNEKEKHIMSIGISTYV